MPDKHDNEETLYRHDALYNALVRKGAGPVSSIFQAILREGLKAFKLTQGIISRIEDNQYTLLGVLSRNHDISVGMVFELQNTYCRKVVSEKKIISVEHAGTDPDFNRLPVHLITRPESYISSPVQVRGHLWGTVNFSSLRARKNRFTPGDHRLIGLLAACVSALAEMAMINQEKENIVLALKKSNDLLEMVFENSTVGMALVSPEGRWLRVNDSLTQMLGYDREYLLSVTFQDITHPADLMSDLELLDALSCGKIQHYQLENRYLMHSGDYLWILLSVSLVRHDDGTVWYYIAQIQDIDERKKMELELSSQKEELDRLNHALEKMATEDSLTGIANRRKFMLWFESEMARTERHPQPFSLALADIDFFKTYNDSYGHQAGDIALKCIATVLSHTLRGQDKVARFGGEEFIILLPETDEKGCRVACEKLRQQIEGMTSLKRIVTISIGAVTYYSRKSEAVQFDYLLNLADSMLYEAKGAGRNQVRVCCCENG